MLLTERIAVVPVELAVGAARGGRGGGSGSGDGSGSGQQLKGAAAAVASADGAVRRRLLEGQYSSTLKQ